MFYEALTTPPRILAVEHMTWLSSAPRVEPRPFAAFSYRIRGSAQIEIHGKTLSVCEGSVLYLPEGVGYTASYNDTEIDCIHFRLSGAVNEPLVFAGASHLGAELLFTSARQTWRNKLPGYELHTLGIFYQLLAVLNRESLSNDREPDRFAGAVEILNKEFADADLTISSVCQRAGLCETTFREQFRRHYAKSPVEYLTERRVEHAKLLLARPSISVESAAVQSGFCDAKYFSRVVKKVYGCTPSALRSRFV